MRHTVSVAANVIRARVKALSALHSLTHDSSPLPLTGDSDPAVNQSIVTGFTMALMHLTGYVADFRIDPLDFYTDPSSLLLLEVDIEIPDDCTVNLSLVGRMIEEYVADNVMVDILPSGHTAAAAYTSMAENVIYRLNNLFDISLNSDWPRIARSH